MKQIRFIHTADLHLDSPFLGLSHLPNELFSRIQESTFAAFENVVDAAIERKVDFIIIAGDLFDGEDRSIKAQARLRRQFERLGEEGISAFISYGNHDHLSGNWLKLDMPEHVHIFNERVECIPFHSANGTKVHLYGFSYPERHVMDRKISEYEKKQNADFHIGLLHGHCEGGNSNHQPYAPFSIPELLEKAMDYWALGHIHKREILHADPPIIYPGNIQGRHRKESGKKGCYAVTLSESGTHDLEFIETAIIRWESIPIDVKETLDLTGLYSTCIRMINEVLETSNQSLLLEINIKNPDLMQPDLLQKLNNGEFLEMIQEETQLDNHFAWPYKITMKTNNQAGSYGEAFIHSLEETAKEMQRNGSIEAAISELYSHLYASRYLESIDDVENLLYSAKEHLLSRFSRS